LGDIEYETLNELKKLVISAIYNWKSLSDKGIERVAKPKTQIQKGFHR
jgi:hypothetical protein